jgi:hypothetical protein
MNRTTLTTAAVLLATASAVLAPSVAFAASGTLAGTWTSIDDDGSTQTLDITGSGHHAYSMVYVDDSATGACDGNPAQISGPGFVEGEDVVMIGTLVCLPGGNDLRTRISVFFDYDTGTQTLTDSFGIVWERAG